MTVTTQELSPIVAGLVYCGVILGCQEAYEVRRAREWTAALGRWCDQQPDLVAFTGRCLVHRAEIMQLGGEWQDALLEATRAGERLAAGFNQGAAAEAFYRQAELHRVRGELDAAEAAYREASIRGREPQPGLALLRLAQRRGDAAVAAIRRVLGETTQASRRAGLLAAAVEIHLAGNDVEGARRLRGARGAGGQLGKGAPDRDRGTRPRRGGAGGGRRGRGTGRSSPGARDLAGARSPLRRGPVPGARRPGLPGARRRRHASLELEAARATFARLGAATDRDRVDALLERGGTPPRHGLTAREHEVLRLVAAGKTNRAIADELVLSARTVDRHVSNIFVKLGVSSRAAATAFAYEHDLV